MSSRRVLILFLSSFQVGLPRHDRERKGFGSSRLFRPHRIQHRPRARSRSTQVLQGPEGVSGVPHRLRGSRSNHRRRALDLQLLGRSRSHPLPLRLHHDDLRSQGQGTQHSSSRRSRRRISSLTRRPSSRRPGGSFGQDSSQGQAHSSSRCVFPSRQFDSFRS